MGRKGRLACILTLVICLLESVCTEAEKDMTYIQDVQGNIHADNSECKVKISLTTKPTASKTTTENLRVAQKGSQGDKGGVGSAGPPGEKGILGEKGDKGGVGSAGPPGEKGILGEKGDKGGVGSAGPPGEKGILGEQGDKGGVGSLGPPGEKGILGEKGDKGGVGSAGPPGEKGILGEKGDKGGVGSLGPPGEKGIPGEKGDIGPLGPPGKKGTSGEKGDKGGIGSRGPPGENGTPGKKGEKGDSYVRGELLGPEMEKHPLGRPQNPGKSCVEATKDGNFYINPPDYFLVNCHIKEHEMCLEDRDMIEESEKDDVAIALGNKTLWLSEKTEFNLDDFYRIRLSQIAYLQGISISVRQKIRFYCYNTDVISTEGDPLLLSLWNGLTSKPTSSIDNPISYKIEKNTCREAAKDTWASAVITLETNLINRLPVVDFYITDIRPGVEQKVYMYLEELCFTYYHK